MKRIVFCGLFAALLIALEASPARVAPEKAPTGWQTKDGLKFINLWQVPEIGIRFPECVMMRMSSDMQKKMESDPLEFLRTRKIFDTDQVQGHLVLRLAEPKVMAASYEALSVACHDEDTYTGYITFQVSSIKGTDAHVK